ncbi:MAG: ATP-binding protein [Lachnospiraceae bacterium]|nr:ATP-binding protein [Lachnospiraceae bacterium]
MLKRKCFEKLEKWKNSTSKKALIVSGARQVGKTFLVEAFAKEQYKSFIELNFIANPELLSIFEGTLTTEAILTGIGLFFPQEKIIDGETLIFLDEIQECPNAVTALKFLSKSSAIDVIASGSALGMSYNRVTSFPVGSVEYVDMTALDFKEFLWAMGISNDIIHNVKEYYDKVEKIPEAIHNQMMRYLKQYMVIGGMPEVVQTFIDNNQDYYSADQVQRRIIRDYIADIARFAKPEIKIKAEACYKSIPDQLNKENHKFQYSVVEKKGSARKFESSVDWLINADMAFAVHNVSYIEYPLRAHTVENSARIYPSDIGLLIGTYDYDLKKLIATDEFEGKATNIILKTVKGGLYEALVADILMKNGHKNLFFYRNESGTAELEFLIEDINGIIPIEVKAGRSGSKTLNNILKKEDVYKGIKLASQNIGVLDKKITLPLYMAMFL